VGLRTAEEESITADGKVRLEEIGADVAIPGGPGVPGVPGIPVGIEKDGAEGIHEIAWIRLGVEDTGIVELEEVSAGNETDSEKVDADEKLPASWATAADVFWDQQRY
jgi:hypothetical protein